MKLTGIVDNMLNFILVKFEVDIRKKNFQKIFENFLSQKFFLVEKNFFSKIFVFYQISNNFSEKNFFRKKKFFENFLSQKIFFGRKIFF